MALVLSNGGKGAYAKEVENRLNILTGILNNVKFDDEQRNEVRKH